MPFYTFETNDENVKNKEFLVRLTYQEYDSYTKIEEDEDGFHQGEGPIHPDTELPVKTWRRVIDSVKVQFAQPWESSKWDNFEYRAGYNMARAQGERRHATEASHVGSTPYQTAEGVDLGTSDIEKYEGRIV